MSEQIPLEFRIGSFQIDRNRVYDSSKPHKYIIENKENQRLIYVSDSPSHREIAFMVGIPTFSEDEFKRVIGAGALYVNSHQLIINGNTRTYLRPTKELVEKFATILLEEFK